MNKIVVKDRVGKIHSLTANPGSTIMEIIRDAGLDIEAACGGCCACATCHVYVHNEWASKLEPKDEDEESMLDQAFEIKENSRLGCQIEFDEDLNGIIVELAPD